MIRPLPLPCPLIHSWSWIAFVIVASTHTPIHSAVHPETPFSILLTAFNSSSEICYAMGQNLKNLFHPVLLWHKYYTVHPDIAVLVK